MCIVLLVLSFTFKFCCNFCKSFFTGFKFKVLFYSKICLLWLMLYAVENENHCDFVRLREMLLRTNMEDLRETTHMRHYELYRRNKLQEMGFSDTESMR